MANTVKISMEGSSKEFKKGVSFKEILNEFGYTEQYPVMLVSANGQLRELHKRVNEDCVVEPIESNTIIGNAVYRRSVLFLMLKAAADLLGDGKKCPVHVEFSLSKGVYCEIRGKEAVDPAFIEHLKARMRELCDMDLPIVKTTMGIQKAKQLFAERDMQDKVSLFKFRQSSYVNVYSIEEYKDYFYGYMASNTGVLKCFDLFNYEKGFVLQMPIAEAPEEVPAFEPPHHLFRVLHETGELYRQMGIETVGQLNEMLVQGRGNELVLLQEALQEKKIGDIAEMIANNPKKKFVLIAGPSSSGKTSFANRLSIQLRTHGLNPHQISVDNYYLDRELIPVDEKGERDLESMDALDVKQLNVDLKKLLNGEEIDRPSYNFKTGYREYHGEKLRMKENDILVVEGIHCLNDALTYDIPKEDKFKVYISALTQLNVDTHNRIATTDGRLLRRMARDARSRGTSARETIKMWPSVRHGEENYIFPYQEQADVMFNSATIYELAVLKDCCMPILYGIPENCPEYPEAKRLLKFLDYFLGFNSDLIPRNSIVREFMGGSCFNV